MFPLSNEVAQYVGVGAREVRSRCQAQSPIAAPRLRKIQPMPAHTIHGDCHHVGWDNALAPVLTVAPWETIAFDCLDASGGQLTAASTVADVTTLDFGRINPVTGPVFIEGAQPGDAVKITLGAFPPSGFGWTAHIPGFGLLADQFPDPALHVWTYDAVSL